MTSPAQAHFDISPANMAAHAVIAHKRIVGQIYKTPLLPSKPSGPGWGVICFSRQITFN